jgi:hypothetical protein
MVTIVTLLIIAIGIVIVVLAVQSRRDRSRPRRQKSKRVGNKKTAPAATPSKPGGIDKLKCNSLFWGVQMDHPGCEAARAILDKQFPFDEAPEMPLEGCDSPTCTCLFKGLLDRRKLHRRTGSDRRKEIRFDEKGKPDRRSRKDRRRGSSWNDRTY